ncbi:hypothetical protein [Paenibacillus mendelii]|uniref:DUF3888 domain-containing protein n=1 Tax=Paenibacillus mendelii TaxID=206163 RepID=A0ABV6JI92_9BACL|nr:hypothetical protein [Paenibacillus mendelii]MCQ6557132.1 hypothetical protein [Paenibacillus mendelii]
MIKWTKTEDKKNDTRYQSTVATKWLVNQIISLLVSNHFENWLRFAGEKKYMDSGKVYLHFNFKTKYNNLPFYTVRVPDEIKDENEIELHWWVEKDLIT